MAAWTRRIPKPSHQRSFAMRRKPLILALLVVVVLVGVVTLALAALVWHDPAFYRRGNISAGHERHVWSRQFETEMSHLFSAIQQDDSSWDASFTADQINSYLLQGFVTSGLDDKILPDTMTAPRVAIEEDRFRLGFRYGHGRWSTIITVDMRLWVGQGEINTVGLELLGLHAGAVPVSAQSLLERISDAIERIN